MQWPPPLRLGYPPGYPIPQKEPGPEIPYTRQKGPGIFNLLPAPSPPPGEETHDCENITFPQLLLWAVINHHNCQDVPYMLANIILNSHLSPYMNKLT